MPRSGRHCLRAVFFKCVAARVNLAELRPSLDYPEIPVLLEHTKGEAQGIAGNRRAPSLYVLWRWVPETQEFFEMGRAASFSWEWAYDLGPLAKPRSRVGWRAAPRRPRARSICRKWRPKYRSSSTNGWMILKPVERERLLGILHDQLAARLSA